MSPGEADGRQITVTGVGIGAVAPLTLAWQGQVLTFLPASLQFAPGVRTDVFAAKNNKTVRQTLLGRRYSRLVPLMVKDEDRLDQPLGLFLSQEALSHLADALAALSIRIRDLLPIVRDHVYHPAFKGSFSIKEVLPALVPELRYQNLAIQDGGAASAALEVLLLDRRA